MSASHLFSLETALLSLSLIILLLLLSVNVELPWLQMRHLCL